MTDLEKLAEISRLLDEAYKHYFEYEGHCKSSEGHISVEFGTYFDRSDNPTDIQIKSVGIYSYVFCREGRSQDFDSLDEALETVRGWHAEEMAYDYNSPEAIENREAMDKMAAEFIETMMKDGRLTVFEMRNEEDEK